jgi:hypothetical protein
VGGSIRPAGISKDKALRQWALVEYFSAGSAPQIIPKNAFARAERTIARGLRSFLAVGLALKAIRDNRLYRKDYSTFLLTPALLAQNTYTNTNTLPRTQTVKYQAALENDRSSVERCLLSAGVKKELMLTAEQKTELKPIEKDFAKTSQEYQAVNVLLRQGCVTAFRPRR